ncbi:MAG TPA: hypothetical protein VGK73_02225 [Polyangiaceae bacterium]
MQSHSFATGTEGFPSANETLAATGNGARALPVLYRASALGLLSLGLGAAALARPRATARLIGTPRSWAARTVLRAVGLREIAVGAGLFASQTTPRAWKWLRVAGDVMDLALLFGSFGKWRANKTRLAVAAVAVGTIAALDVLAAARSDR